MRSSFVRRPDAAYRLPAAGSVLVTIALVPAPASAAARPESPQAAPVAASGKGGPPPKPIPPSRTVPPTPAQGRHPGELDRGPQRDQADEAQPDGNSAMAAAKARGHRVVVDNQSAATRTTYANPDGSFTRTTVPPGVFRVEHGTRVRTDLTVTSSSDATYPLDVPGAVKPLHLGRNAAHLLAWDLPGGTVTATTDDSATTGPPTADDSGAITWPGSAHSNLRVVPTLTGFDGQLVLQDAQARPRFTLTLHDPHHALAGTGAATNSGGWSIPAADGISHLVLDAPHAYETTVATGESLPRSTPARLTVTRRGTDYDVTTAVDPSWLAGKRFPIVIDPRSTFDTGEWGYTNAQPIPDCPVTDLNGGNNQNCFQGHDLDYVADGGYGDYRIQIRPDLTGIPPNAQVVSATLWMNAIDTAPYPSQLILLCNSYGYYGEIGGDTWNSTYGGNPGGNCTSSYSSGSGWQSFDFASNAQHYVNSGSNTGLVLRENCEYNNCTEYTHFTSGWDGGYGSPWPEATVTWAAPPQSTPTPVTLAAGDTTLTASWNYPSDDGGNLVESYNIYTTDTTTDTLVGGTYQNVSAGTYSKSYTSADGIINGHNYYSFILACNDHGCGPGTATPTVAPAGLPAAPTDVFADPGPGDAQVTAQWSPASGNGATITAYVVTATPASGSSVSVSVAGNATTATAGGLIDGTDYTVTVAAVNSVGTGSTAPAAYTVTAAGQPSAVASVTAVAEDGGAIVYFPAATAIGADIVDYDVTATPGGASVQTDGNTTTAFTGLTNGTSYTFTVTAHDVLGDGPVSVTSNAVTPTTGAGNAQTDVETSWALNAAASSGQRVEIPGLRTATSSTFAEADGTLTTDLAAVPVRQFNNGFWFDIDPTLHREAGAIEPAVLPVDLALGIGGGTTISTLQTGNNTSISSSWSSALPEPTLQDATATYPGVGTSIDLLSTAQRDGVDEALRLNSSSAGTPTIRLHLDTPGLTVAQAVDGSLAYYDSSGALVATSPGSTMTDSQVDPNSGDPSNRGSVISTLTPGSSGGYDLAIAPDPAFLEASTTKYPVVIDPPTVRLVGDAFIQTTYYSNQASSTQLRSGTYNNGAAQARSLLKFDVSGYRGRSVNNATLKLYNVHSWNCNVLQTDIFQIVSSWTPNTVTWRNQPAVASSPTAHASFAYGDSCGGGQYASFNVKILVTAWAGGTANNGFEVRADSETDSNFWKKFSSSEGPNSQVPLLQVNASAPPQKAPPPPHQPPANSPGPPGGQAPPPSNGQQTGKLWGVDVTDNANDTYNAKANYAGQASGDTWYDATNKTFGQPQLFGQYLGTLTQADAGYLHDKRRASKVLVISNLGVGTRREDSCANGKTDADATADSAIRTHVPTNTVLFYDSEAPAPTQSNTGSYVTADWVKCFEDELTSYSASKHTPYRPGFYGAPYSTAEFQGAYCAAVKADKKYVAYTYVTDPDPNRSPSRGQSPSKYAPTHYNCASRSYVWQYRLAGGSTVPSVDSDEYQGTTGVLW